MRTTRTALMLDARWSQFAALNIAGFAESFEEAVGARISDEEGSHTQRARRCGTVRRASVRARMLGNANEATRNHYAAWRRGGGVAARGHGAAARAYAAHRRAHGGPGCKRCGRTGP